MFWNEKRVLVTGHTGFKGGWLSLWLSRLGAQVTGYSLAPPTTPSLFDLARIGEDLSDLREDVRDGERLKDAVRHTRPEIVFHLAAQPLVRESYRNPVETFATNVMGTVNLLEAVRSSSARVVIVVTSDKCYENREWLWGYRETEPLGGDDPYSASKGAAEIVTSAFRAAFFSPQDDEGGAAVASVRAGNVIGGGDWSIDRLIPDIVRAFAAREVVSIRNPKAERPWQHVLDALNGYLMLAERLWESRSLAEAWNFGPSEEHTREVGWIVGRMSELWGDGAQWRLDDAPGPHEATLLRLDSSKARKRLGWRPKLNVGDALQWTVDWYRSHEAGRDMRAVTLDQLTRYGSMQQTNGLV